MPVLFFIISLSLSALFSQNLTTDQSAHFSGSGNCAVCHAPGGTNPNALENSSGEDVSPVTYWRSSMMANAARDPYWRAKVSAEVYHHPEHQQFIEDKCTTCHAPAARTEAHLAGEDYFGMNGLAGNGLALDGVSCTVCHQIESDNFGLETSFSGNYIVNTDHIIYGPYVDFFGQPMINMSGYIPEYSEHIQSSDLCGTCHTLFTPTLDEGGNIVDEIAEQTPYLEWLNSSYPTMDVQCQACHVPQIDEPVTISNRPSWLGSQQPFGLHEFVGGNVYMLKLLRDFREELELTADESHIDSTLARTVRQLENAVQMDVIPIWTFSDSLTLDVIITSLTGHKFPTGFPSRRVWISVVVTDMDEDTLFSSGIVDENHEIIGIEADYERHHNTINAENQIQIYEAVMGNPASEVTYTLLHGSTYLKDNRLPPSGFTSTGPHYEHTAVYGNALIDENFNHQNEIEGSGSDAVKYRIHIPENLGEVMIRVQLNYQSLAPRFVEDLQQVPTEEVETFLAMYQATSNAPFIIHETQMNLQAEINQQGDINMDGTVDVMDIVLLVSIILGSVIPDEAQVSAADINSDGSLDVLDVLLIVNVILNP